VVLDFSSTNIANTIMAQEAVSSVPDKETQDTETSTLEKESIHDIVKAEDTASSTLDETPKDVEVEKKETQAVEDTSGYPTGFKLVTLIIALCLAVFLVALDQTIIATAIPKITDHFNSINDIGWYGSAYFLTSCSLQPSFGRIYKVFNVCFLQPVSRLYKSITMLTFM